MYVSLCVTVLSYEFCMVSTKNRKNNHGNLNGVNGLPQVCVCVCVGGGGQGSGNPGVMGGRSTGGGRRGGGRPDI